MENINSDQQHYWFALESRVRGEQTIATYLKDSGYKVFLPTRKTASLGTSSRRSSESALFPGYLFCFFNPQKRLPILKTPGVKGIVSLGKNPLPVDDKEIEALRRLIQSEHKLKDWNYPQIGEAVQIVKGPLEGVTGVVTQHRNEMNFIVSITILKRSVAVQIDPKLLSRYQVVTNYSQSVANLRDKTEIS